MMLWIYCKGRLVALPSKAYITQMFSLHCFYVESIFFLLDKEIAFETNKWECLRPFWSYFKMIFVLLGMCSNNFNVAWKLSDFVFHFFILCASGDVSSFTQVPEGFETCPFLVLIHTCFGFTFFEVLWFLFSMTHKILHLNNVFLNTVNTVVTVHFQSWLILVFSREHCFFLHHYFGEGN